MKLMQASSFEKEFEVLAERMVNFGDTWIYTSELYDKNTSDTYMESQGDAMLAMIYPYLTAEGKQEFEKVIPNWF